MEKSKVNGFEFAWGQANVEVKESDLEEMSNEKFAELYFPSNAKPNVSVERSKKILVEAAASGKISGISKETLAKWVEKEGQIEFDEGPLTPSIVSGVLKSYLTYTRAQMILKPAMLKGLRRSGKEIMEDTFGRATVLDANGEPLLKEKPGRGFKSKEIVLEIDKEVSFG